MTGLAFFCRFVFLPVDVAAAPCGNADATNSSLPLTFVRFMCWLFWGSLAGAASFPRIASADSGHGFMVLPTHRPLSSSFYGSYLESYTGIPKRNYFGAYGQTRVESYEHSTMDAAIRRTDTSILPADISNPETLHVPIQGGGSGCKVKP